jgi:phospholipid/cholesterol/gamma-HCH transport system ATP-binding protein
METSAPASVLSLRQAAFFERRIAARPVALDLELGRGQLALVEVEDEVDAVAFVDLCVGLAPATLGGAFFLGREWRAETYRENLDRRGQIGSVVQSQVWPAHLSIAQSVLMPRLYHTRRAEDDVIAEATVLARRFGLPGLPVGRRETMPAGELVRAACVRAFLGTPDLVVIHDAALDQIAELAVPMAQALAAVQDRGGAAIWVTDYAGVPAARFVAADHVLRLGDRGLVAARRRQ